MDADEAAAAGASTVEDALGADVGAAAPGTTDAVAAEDPAAAVLEEGKGAGRGTVGGLTSVKGRPRLRLCASCRRWN